MKKTPPDSMNAVKTSSFGLFAEGPEIPNLLKTSKQLSTKLSEFMLMANGEAAVVRNGLEETSISSSFYIDQQKKLCEACRVKWTPEIQGFFKRFYKGICQAKSSHSIRFFGDKLPERGIQVHWEKQSDLYEAGLELMKLGLIPKLFENISQSLIKSCIAENSARFSSFEKILEQRAAEVVELKDKIGKFETNIKFSELVNEWEDFLSLNEKLETFNIRLNDKFVKAHKKRNNKYDPDGLKLISDSICYPYLASFISLKNLRYKLEKKEKPIAFSMPRDNTVRVRLGTNYLRYEVNQDFTVLSVMIDKKKHHFRLSKSDYFKEIKAEEIIENGKDTGTYQLNFKHGKYDFKGILKEPSIAYRNGKLCLYVPFNYECKGIKKTNKASKYFRSSWITNTKKTKGDVFVGLRVMSVDLGKVPVAVASVYELQKKSVGDYSFKVDGFGYANLQVRNMICGSVQNSDTFNKVMDFRKKIRFAKSVMWYASTLLKKLNKPAELPAEAMQYFEIKDFAYQSLRDSLHQICANLKKEYSSILELQMFKTAVNSEVIQWLETADALISLLQKWAFLGKKPLDKGYVPKSVFLGTYRKYCRNLKDNLIKKIASWIKDRAIANKCNIILLEDLEEYTQSIKNDKKENNLLRLWSARTIQKTIEEAVKPFGIVVEFIDPRNSSTKDPETGEFGCRGDGYENGYLKNKRHLYCKRDSGHVVIDSDEAATLNLQRTFWTRGSDVNSVVGFLSDGVLTPNLGKMVRGAFKKSCGKELVVFKEDKTGFKLTPVTPKKYESYFENRPKGAEEIRLYKHGDNWLLLEQHIEANQAIREGYNQQTFFDVS